MIPGAMPAVAEPPIGPPKPERSKRSTEAKKNALSTFLAVPRYSVLPVAVSTDFSLASIRLPYKSDNNGMSIDLSIVKRNCIGLGNLG